MLSNHNILPIGLYRRNEEIKTSLFNFYASDFASDHENSDEDDTSLSDDKLIARDNVLSRYVFTNPPPKTIIRDDDQVSRE
jgi:hypothetical protein